LPLALLSFVVFAAVFVLGLMRRRLSWRGLLMGMVGVLLSLIVSVVVVTAVWWLARYLNTNLHPFLIGGFYQDELYLLAFLAFALAITYPLLRWLARPEKANGAQGVTAVYAGILFAWVILSLLIANALPGFSYLFAWPLLFALAGLAWLVFRPAENRPLRTAAILAVVAIPALLLFAPVLHFFSVYAARMEGLMGLPVAALPIPFAVLLFALLLPQLAALAPQRQRWLPLGILFAGIGLLLLATLRSGFSVEQPKANTVIYRLNADTGQAHWLTLNDSRAGRGTRAQLDEWTGQFFPDGGEEVSFNPWLNGWLPGEFPALQTAAPVVELPQTQVNVLSDTVEDGQRHVQWQMVASPEVLETYLDVQVAGRVLVLNLNGQPVDVGDSENAAMHFNLYGRAAEGFVFDVIAEGEAPITLTMQDHIPTLPEVPGLEIQPRPEWMMPAPWQNVADSSLVTHTITLD
jgi:hypothetical protein